MLFHFLFPSLLALALVDEVEEVDEMEEVDEAEEEVLDDGSLCNLTRVGRRLFDRGDMKSERLIKVLRHLPWLCRLNLTCFIYAGRSGGKP